MDAVVQRSNKTEELVQELKRLILNNTLIGGARLKEAELAAQFSTSRTPVREALVALEQEGVVTYQKNCGFTVRLFTQADISEAYETRAVLEGYIAGRAARAGLSMLDMQRLKECTSSVNELLDSDMSAADLLKVWRSYNLRFHEIISGTLHNDMLQRSLAKACHVPRVHDWLKKRPDEIKVAIAKYNGEHAAIALAIEHRDSYRAEFLMRDHVMQAALFIQPRG